MPQENIYTITGITQEAYQCIEKFGLAPASRQDYWYYGVVPIREYFSSHGCTIYSPEKMQECIAYFSGQYEKGGTHIRRFRKSRKIARIIESILAGEPVVWKYLEPKTMPVLPSPFQKYIDQYLDFRSSQGAKEATLRRLRTALKHFLLYASSLGYNDLQPFTEQDAQNYIPVLSKSYKRTGDCLSLLRPFGTYLFSHGLISIRLDRSFQIKAPIRQKCHVGFTKNEALQIITNISRTGACGKRDYAILMLAMHTGLRGVDVLGLKFSDIDWMKKEIHLIQSKTGKELRLPVPASVLNAIADYILSARPEAEEKDIIFLRSRRPYIPMKEWSAFSIVKRAAGHAGIKWTAAEHKGFHSFRRSIASQLLEGEVPLDTIKEILGHANADSLKPYISVSRPGLSACALDLSEIPLRREELQ